MIIDELFGMLTRKTNPASMEQVNDNPTRDPVHLVSDYTTYNPDCELERMANIGYIKPSLQFQDAYGV